jgi:hypothetical protein
MFQFILGAIAGGVAAWWYRNDIQNYMDDKLPNVRHKAADRLAAIETRAEEALGRAKSSIDRMRPASGSGGSTPGSEQSRTRDISSSTRTGSGYTPGTGGSSYTQGTGSGV